MFHIINLAHFYRMQHVGFIVLMLDVICFKKNLDTLHNYIIRLSADLSGHDLV